MNATLITLPQPILVSDEERLESDKVFDGYNLIKNYRDTWGEPCFKKIIAGTEGLPKLDLSLISERIGWVDVERLAVSAFQKRFNREPIIMGSAEADSFWLNTWIDSFKAAQSLNEKKYSEEDLIEFAKFCLDYDALLSLTNLANQWSIDSQKAIKLWLQKRKPKEYQVEYTQEGNTIKVTKIIKPC